MNVIISVKIKSIYWLGYTNSKIITTPSQSPTAIDDPKLINVCEGFEQVKPFPSDRWESIRPDYSNNGDYEATG